MENSWYIVIILCTLIIVCALLFLAYKRRLFREYRRFMVESELIFFACEVAGSTDAHNSAHNRFDYNRLASKYYLPPSYLPLKQYLDAYEIAYKLQLRDAESLVAIYQYLNARYKFGGDLTVVTACAEKLDTDKLGKFLTEFISCGKKINLKAY